MQHLFGCMHIVNSQIFLPDIARLTSDIIFLVSCIYGRYRISLLIKKTPKGGGRGRGARLKEE